MPANSLLGSLWAHRHMPREVSVTLMLGNGLVIIGTATVQGNAFSVGGASFTVSGGSATLAYSLAAGSLATSSLNATSSVTAFAFFGDGSHLSGVAFTGGVAANQTTFQSTVTVQGSAGFKINRIICI